MTDEQPKRICGANRHNGRGVCQSTVLYPNGRCRMHGGPTPTGVASPHFKHGKHMRGDRRYLVPTKMKEGYEELWANRDTLLDGLEEIAVVSARIGQLLTELEEENVGELNIEVFRAFDDFRAALTVNNQNRMRETFAKLQILMERARTVEAKTAELWEIMDLQRRQRETERKRIVALTKMMTAEEAKLFFIQVQEAVRSAVDVIEDRDLRDRVLRTFTDKVTRSLALPG